MAITPSVSTSYKMGMIQGQFFLADTYMVALYNSSATLGPTTPSYTTLNEVSGGNYPAGGIVMPGASAVLDVTTAILTFSNATFSNLTLPDVRGCMIYDATQGNTMVACFDFGQSLSLYTSNFTLIVPAATASTGLIRFS